MDSDLLFQLCKAIENSPAGVWLRTNIMAIPTADAVHVLAIAILFGTIFAVDLRLIGVASNRWSVTQVSHALTRFTWIAFVVAAITGTAMFVANPTTYYINLAARIKLVLLFLAGLNMFIYELVTQRSVANWDTGPTPMAAKVGGLLSIVLWSGVLVFGRIIGYTKETPFDVTVPEGLDLDNLSFS